MQQVETERWAGLELRELTTETRNSDTWNLDEMTPFEIAQIMNRNDAGVPEAITPHLEQIARIISAVEQAFLNGGRLIYIGAGTSGRLGVLDASECPPTFGVSEDQVIGLIAGGDIALRSPVEGAEDNMDLGKEDLEKLHITDKDVVIGLAASGRTPYVVGGLRYARNVGCVTAAVVCNSGSRIAKEADIPVEIEVGPEILTGSTRLKAGTAQKLVLNMISTGAMVRTGKAYQNLMVNVVQSNQKLCTRAENIVMDATGVDRTTARKVIDQAEGSVKLAVVMVLVDCGVGEAKDLLEQSAGHVREAVRIAGQKREGR